MNSKDFDNGLIIFNKFKNELKNPKEFQKKFIAEFKQMKFDEDKKLNDKLIEIKVKENILNKRILEATEIIEKSEKIFSEQEEKLINKINPNIILWKNRKKILSILEKISKFGVKVDIEKFSLAFQEIDINSMDITNISKLLPLIFNLLKDKYFEEVFIELIQFISKDEIVMDNLGYFDIANLLKGFFLFIKKNMQK